MRSCQRILCAMVWLVIAEQAIVTLAAPTAEADPSPEASKSFADDEPKFVRITEDVIPDIVENSTQKVIRVNPLDLPPIGDDPTKDMDSSLYNIQSLMPGHRPYVNSKRMRKPKFDENFRESKNFPQEKVYKRRPKKKQLHFLYNQNDLEGHPISKTMRVHLAPGAYPVYYAISKSNGRFGKFPIKGFRNQAEFKKYLVKSKLEPIELAQRFNR